MHFICIVLITNVVECLLILLVISVYFENCLYLPIFIFFIFIDI